VAEKKLVNEARKPKSFEVSYDRTLQCITLRIGDPEAMFPLLLIDPIAGPYKISRTRKGGLQMTR